MHIPLPTHARTGLAAIGFRKPRPGETGPQPIWPVRGGSEPPTDPADAQPAAPPAPVPTPSQVFPPAQPQQPQPQPQNTPDVDLSALNAVIAELGLTPAQIKGRLEASRKWEDRAKEKDPVIQALKEKADKFDQLQAEAMSEQERAVAAAKQEGRAEALAEAGAKLAASALRTSLTLTGRMEKEQIDALLAPLDTKAFLTDDGLSVDADRVTAYVNVVAPAPVAPATVPAVPPATPPAAAEPAKGADRQVPDMGQGNRTSTAPSGLAAGAEIAKARAAQRTAPPVIAR